MRKWKRGKERGRFVCCCGCTDLITLPLSKHQGNPSLLPQLTDITLLRHWPPPSLGRTSSTRKGSAYTEAGEAGFYLHWSAVVRANHHFYFSDHHSMMDTMVVRRRSYTITDTYVVCRPSYIRTT